MLIRGQKAFAIVKDLTEDVINLISRAGDNQIHKGKTYAEYSCLAQIFRA